MCVPGSLERIETAGRRISTAESLLTSIHEDQVLARAAALGEEAAWRRIYESTRDRLFGFLCYQLGNRNEALDVLQETYVAAVGAIGRYEGRSSLECWLTGIALRRARNWKRRFLSRMRNTVSLDASEALGLAARNECPETAFKLDRAFRRIPRRQATAVLLHEWLGYPFQEVALAMGIGEATARVHAFRGREALRAILEEENSAPMSAPVAGESS